MLSKRIRNGYVIVCFNGPPDVRALVEITKEHPGMPVMIHMGTEESCDEIMAKASEAQDPLDFGTLNDLLITYAGNSPPAIMPKGGILPPPNSNPMAGRYGQVRQKGKHR